MARLEDMILVYDFYPHGHCPGWMELVAMAFIDSGYKVVVACCADCEFVAPMVRRIKGCGGRVVTIPKSTDVQAAYAIQLAYSMGIKHIFFPHFDSVVIDLGKNKKEVDFSGLSVGGIWLRPTLEGEYLSGMKKIFNKITRTPSAKKTRRMNRTIEHNLAGMNRFLNGKGAAKELFLFLLEGESPDNVLTLLTESQIAYICDPWLERSGDSREEARIKLGLDADRIYFLHAGTSRPDKGLADACQAFLQLPQSVRESAMLLRAGSVDSKDAPLLNELEKAGQAVVMNRYLNDEELWSTYAACDFVLLPYRDQKESSGIFIHAAAHERPVIASDFGLIGKWTKQYNLGWTFPHKDIAGLMQLIESVYQKPIIDPAGMREFAAINAPEAFKKVLVEQWERDVLNVLHKR
jgi:glycosyltransferase involved in cell wall biosynthesis